MCFEVKAFIKGSYNLNFLLEDAKGEKWVAKVCRSLEQFKLDFQNLDDRSILAWRLISSRLSAASTWRNTNLSLLTTPHVCLVQ